MGATVDGMDVTRPLLIGTLVLTEVAIWQWRMVIAHRGKPGAAMLLGIVGAVLQITAITQVVANVRNPLSIGAYATGVGLGVLFGLLAGERLTPGRLSVTVVSVVPSLAETLWRRGWEMTAHHGQRHDGPVSVLTVAIDRRDEAPLRASVQAVDPDARWTAKELRDVDTVRRARRVIAPR